MSKRCPVSTVIVLYIYMYKGKLENLLTVSVFPLLSFKTVYCLRVLLLRYVLLELCVDHFRGSEQDKRTHH